MKTWTLIEICLVAGCFICAWFSWNPREPEQKLMSVIQIQQELVSRGYDIKVDGKFGPNTDNALNRALIEDNKF